MRCSGFDILTLVTTGSPLLWVVDKNSTDISRWLPSSQTPSQKPPMKLRELFSYSWPSGNSEIVKGSSTRTSEPTPLVVCVLRSANLGTSLVPLIVTVMVSVTVSPTSSSAVTSYSNVMDSPTSKKSKSKSCTFNVQVAVLPSVVMEEGENAPSKAWRKSAERVTPLLGVTVADAAPVMVR